MIEIITTPTGFEPVTHSLEGCCSIPLSYGISSTSLGDIARLHAPGVNVKSGSAVGAAATQPEAKR